MSYALSAPRITSTCFEPLKKMNVGLWARVSRLGMSVESSDSHCRDLVLGRNGLGSIDIALQEVNAGVLLGERFKHWGNLVAWPTPRPSQVNHEAVCTYEIQFSHHVAWKSMT